MARHSSLGPIDPQIILRGPNGAQSYPAQAVLEQFDQAKEECKDPELLGTWMPILGQYGPSLLVQCQNATDLARRLVGRWIWQYMFDEDKSRRRKATGIAQKLSNHKRFLSHSRHISRSKAKELGLVVEDLEDDQTLQNLVLATFHATSHTFAGTAAVKIIENQMGRAFIKQERQIQVVQGSQQQQQQQTLPAGPKAPAPAPGHS